MFPRPARFPDWISKVDVCRAAFPRSRPKPRACRKVNVSPVTCAHPASIRSRARQREAAASAATKDLPARRQSLVNAAVETAAAFRALHWRRSNKRNLVETAAPENSRCARRQNWWTIQQGHLQPARLHPSAPKGAACWTVCRPWLHAHPFSRVMAVRNITRACRVSIRAMVEPRARATLFQVITPSSRRASWRVAVMVGGVARPKRGCRRTTPTSLIRAAVQRASMCASHQKPRCWTQISGPLCVRTRYSGRRAAVLPRALRPFDRARACCAARRARPWSSAYPASIQ